MRNIIKMIIIMIGILAIVLISNGFIWWGLGSLFVWAFEIPYTWSFIKGFALGLILIMASPVNIKFDADELRSKLIDIEEEDENID